MGKNILKLDLSGFEEMLTRLDSLGGDVKNVVTDALEQCAETVEWDTKEAMANSNLPAGGKYSQGKTEKSIVENAKVTWSGTVASIGIGFDFGKQGAGGFLITGTPKMKPNYELQKIYKRKKYISDLQKDMYEIVNDAIIDKMGG